MSADNPSPRPQYFFIDAAADAGALSRILAPFAKLDFLPARLEAVAIDGRLLVRMEFPSMAEDWARKLAAGLRQSPCVGSVVNSQDAAQSFRRRETVRGAGAERRHRDDRTVAMTAGVG
jgi:hypothetical protein